MQDLIYLVLTVASFALLAAFVIGCERIIGSDDDGAVPGGMHEAIELDPLVAEAAAAR